MEMRRSIKYAFNLKTWGHLFQKPAFTQGKILGGEGEMKRNKRERGIRKNRWQEIQSKRERRRLREKKERGIKNELPNI